MVTKTFGNNGTVTGKVRTTWAAYLEVSTLHRERLIASEKARLHASILLDSDYDRIAGWMARWRERYLDRHEVS